MIKFGVRIAPLYSPNFIFQNNGTIIFEGSVTIAENSYLSCNEGGGIIFGNNVSFNSGARIISSNLITICENSKFSWDDTIVDDDIHAVVNINTGEEIVQTRPIVIGKSCWVGFGCVISKGVSLADYTIVSSCSKVVGKHDKMFTILAGVPAKIIKEGYVRKDLWKL